MRARSPGALGAFVRKELHHILRDRQTLVILLLMPLVQVLLFGYALRTDVRDLRVAIVDPTPDAVTLRLRNRLEATPRFRIVSVVSSARALESQFERRRARGHAHDAEPRRSLEPAAQAQRERVRSRIHHRHAKIAHVGTERVTEQQYLHERH